LRVYAQATANAENNSVTVLAINLDDQRDAAVSFPEFVNRPYQEYAMNASDIFGTSVQLNGQELKLMNDQTLPEMQGISHEASGTPTISIHSLSYTFVVFPNK
jgi:hypothetical protein